MTAHRSRNLLYYGDNLDILRRYVPDESVDLIYLDPPFNSNQDYNVLFAERDGARAAAQIKAFEDTWHWDQSAAAAYRDAVLAGGKVAETMQAFRALLGESDMMAYLTMMAPRLVELRRVLKPTGSIYLHCDPTASHYLKLLLDGVFGGLNFRNEIVWTRTISKSLMTRRLPSNHDIIFTYQKTGEAKWNLDAVFVPYDPDQLDEKTALKYCHRDPDGRVYRWDNLINPNRNRPNLTYEFLGVTKVWRWTRERMQEAYESGLIVQTKPGAVPQLKRYLDEQRGRPLGDVWNDIPPINSQAVERLGYPTQKPEALLTRIINASSNPGDTVLDPFCGCGTAIAVAHRLGRRWIGIDITHIAITLIKARMADTFLGRARYNVIGEPVSAEDAATLAAADPFQFQLWALGLVGARPADIKKGADRGIDGRIFFFDDATGKARQIVISVKAGHVMRAHVHELRGVLEREGAAMGVFISLAEPTRPMREEAAAAGFYESAGWGKSYPRIQLRTVAELLAGKALERPPSAATFKKAPLARADSSATPDLFDE